LQEKPIMKKIKILDENHYQTKWHEDKIYSYKPLKGDTFVIDTPPPTISGALHIGHVFSYVQTDILARFQRMRGKNVFYPMGWDNNGLPTERRVQNLYKINCDPTIKKDPLTLDELLKRKSQKSSTYLPVSRNTFIDICLKQTHEDQKEYEKLWRRLSLSIDWDQTYETISPFVQAISQRSFLDLYNKNFVENRHTPVFWDTQFKTAVAQADIEDRKKQGFYNDIKFLVKDSKESIVISTTRPELLPACIAITAHPEDERYKKFFHKWAVTPLFSSVVPILPSLNADPKKGTGALMVCTFGDMADVLFWKENNMPLKQVIDSDGLFQPIFFEKSGDKSDETFLKDKKLDSHKSEDNKFFSLKPDKANEFYAHLKGLRVRQVRTKIVDILLETQYIISAPKPTEQFVKFYEKGDYPLELLPTRQWYIKILNYKDQLLEQGRKVNWHPPSMLKRYEQWVEGLNQDWCISRQRFFGVPFPIWYPLGKDKTPDYENPILPHCILDKPLDPMSSAPMDWGNQEGKEGKDFTEEQRGKTFIADTAVMDTWATSSLTPQINSKWGMDEKRHKALFPADLRPQAHEIIRTWAFYTIAKSFFHSATIPWKHVAVSGWVMDADRLKLSKSKGKNSFSPEDLMEKYSADAIRYWAGKAKLGMDTLYDENIFKIGQKLVLKMNNAFKFTNLQTQGMQKFFTSLEDISMDSFDFKNVISSSFVGIDKSIYFINDIIDQSWMSYLLHVHQKSISLLAKFHYSQALELIEKSFWLFCDNYLELVKSRAYKFSHFDKKFKKDMLPFYQGSCSAVCSLDLSMYLFTKMLAPYMPYITEHIWLQRYSNLSLEVSSRAGVSSRAEGITVSVHSSFLEDLDFFSEYLNRSFNTHLKTKNLVSIHYDRFLNFTFYLLEQIRSQKSMQQKSLSAPIKELKITLNKEDKKLFDLCSKDLTQATNTNNICLEIKEEVESPKISITLS